MPNAYYPVYAEDSVFGLLILQNYRSSPFLQPRTMKTMFLERIGLHAHVVQNHWFVPTLLKLDKFHSVWTLPYSMSEVSKVHSRDVANGKLIDLAELV